MNAGGSTSASLFPVMPVGIICGNFPILVFGRCNAHILHEILSMLAVMCYSTHSKDPEMLSFYAFPIILCKLKTEGSTDSLFFYAHSSTKLRIRSE